MNSINNITKAFLNINQVVKEKSSIKTLKKFAEGVKEKVPAPVTEEEVADKENQENMETTEGEETTPNAGQSGTRTEEQTPSLQLAPPPLPLKKKSFVYWVQIFKMECFRHEFHYKICKGEDLDFLILTRIEKPFPFSSMINQFSCI